jgi:WhiB family transcriptional regulator, redox-sensing transcriptional regulator
VSLSSAFLTTVLEEEWQEQAACQEVDQDLFFSLDETDQREALQLCRGCPVQQDCLRFAIEQREMYGIWGGMRESERRSMIRERRRQDRERRRADEAA